ncbi:MAG: hypothetical protein JO363_23380, partial [Solirubrobacterales bacterium]|nr:hypothetical protein [Solirubrobacterales bacterium]
PELLALGPPEQPRALEEPVPKFDHITIEAGERAASAEPEPAAQLGLF